MFESVTAVARKELGQFFGSPIGYLFLLAYLGVTLFVFFWGEAFFARNIADVRPMFEWLPILLIFLSAALTMRLWSDERRSGTLEFVVTVPVSAWRFVVGKFFACWALLALALVMTLPLALTVGAIGDLDWGPVLAGYLAAALLGAAYIAVGLYVSAQTDNQIVALILATFLCGAFYLVGSPAVVELFNNEIGEALRGFGAGARFESIARGVLDLRDLYYYGSLAAVFLALNVYVVERHGWAADGDQARHRRAQRVTALVVLNVVAANVWLAGVSFLRWDTTEGDQYSISEATRSYLAQLREPLLVRGYFSAKTHPLLAPLAPRLKDLLREYEVAADGKLRLELVDPADDPEAEDEANTKYGIRPVPFQVADRYQASLVNSYFDVLIQYGDEYETLGFRDLIEVKVRGEADLDVRLRNPEYDLTRSIKKVLYGFQGGGSIFDSVASPVTFTGYISADDRLPPTLAALKADLAEVLDELQAASGGKLSTEVRDPEAGDGALAVEIQERYGFAPMAASLFDANTFYFYLTLSDGETVLPMPIPEAFDADGLKRGIEEGLKRFADGLLQTVAVHAPTPPNPYMQQQMPTPPGNQFGELQQFLRADFDVESASLEDGGAIAADAGVLLVAGPQGLDDGQVFAIDQFLMRGGTVVVLSGAYDVSLSGQFLNATPADSGLDAWLAHHGVTIDDALVMDPRNAAFPVPVQRQVGGFTFQELVMLDYPYFVDVRDAGLNADVAAIAELPQVTVPWGSPVDVDAEVNAGRVVTALLTSSPDSWRSASTELMPRISETGLAAFQPDGPVGANPLAVMIEGRFDSFFEESPLLAAAAEAAAAEAQGDPLADASDAAGQEAGDAAAGADGDLLADAAGHGDAEDADAADAEEAADDDAADLGDIGSVIARSPESARLIVAGSAAFVDDQTLRMMGSADGTVYTNSIQLIANLVDLSVEDQALLSIRSRGHFNRTLPSMPEDRQRVWEYINYGVAALAVFGAFGVNAGRRARRRQAQAQWLKERA